MIAYNCPHCGHQLRILDQYAGQTGVCAKCKQRITVPLISRSRAPVPAADPAEIQGLVSKLYPASWQVWVSATARRDAALALGKTGSKEAIPPLLKALDDQDPALYTAAAEALGSLALDSGTDTRVAALAALGVVLGKKHEAVICDRAVEMLVEALGDPEAAVQKEAVRTMLRVLMAPEYREYEPAFLALCRQALIVQANAAPNSGAGREAAHAWGMVWATHSHWEWTPQSFVERKIAVRALLSVLEHARDPELTARAEKMLVARVGHFGLEWLEEASKSASPYLREIIKRITDVILGRQSHETFDLDMQRTRNVPEGSEERRRMIAESLSKDQHFFEEQKARTEAERIAAERGKMFDGS